MILFFLAPPVIASTALVWAYTHRDDDRLSETTAPRHLAG